MARDNPRNVEDIGLVASLDPVAVDKATTDLVISLSRGRDVFLKGYDIDWSIQLSHGEKIGLGSIDYKLVEVG
jgi:uncharacterized Fe-S center protein